ncbi:F-box only protein 39-like [Physella acuta]|uniref:F-box only protein 39-like n=1 Tax=Physella acuta TaxID=109671 RepID=UPI0027DBA26C|nr:F-box only protein 39-like [Physella acuta]
MAVDKRGKQAKRKCQTKKAKRGKEIVKQTDWSKLPHAVLLHLFQYLPHADKYHAAQTCKTWLQPMSEPSLFQTGHFRFDSVGVNRAITYVKVRGKLLRHIKVDCSVSINYQPQTRAMYQFLVNLLNSGNDQLLTLSLTNTWHLNEGIEYPRSMLVQLMAAVLTSQQQLRALDLCSANVSVDQGRDLLEAASRNSAYTVHKLAIVDLIRNFRGDVDLRRSPKLIAAMCNFPNLRELDLNNDYLTDELLDRLAETTKSLQVMTVNANDYLKAWSRTTPPAWQKLRSFCCQLKVVFLIKPKTGYYFDPALMGLLTPSTPLHTLDWTSGELISLDHIKQCFQHIATHFQNSIRHLKFQSAVRLDSSDIGMLFESIHTCRYLKTLSISLKCDLSGDDKFYKTAIQDAVDVHRMTCAVTFNGQTMKS